MDENPYRAPQGRNRSDSTGVMSSVGRRLISALCAFLAIIFCIPLATNLQEPWSSQAVILSIASAAGALSFMAMAIGIWKHLHVLCWLGIVMIGTVFIFVHALVPQ
jgi:hypothetical protein